MMNGVPGAIYCRWAGCNLYFEDSEVLLLHCTNDHVGRKNTNNLCLDCHWDGCDVKTTKRDHITSHLRVHIAHKPHICSRCSKAFKRPQDLKKHEKLHAEGQETQLTDDNMKFSGQVPHSFPAEYISMYNTDSINRGRDLSPQSASSELLATTPPSGMLFPSQLPQPMNQLFSGIYNKNLSPEYNQELATMINTISTSSEHPQVLASAMQNMDINQFNSFMGQLHSSLAPGIPPLFDSQISPNNDQFVDPTYSIYPPNSVPSCISPEAYGGFQNFNQNNIPNYSLNQDSSALYTQAQMQNFSQQYQQMQVGYPSLDFGQNGLTSQQVYNPALTPTIQVSQDSSVFSAPQVDYSEYPQYISMEVTPQRSGPVKVSSAETAVIKDEGAKEAPALDETEKPVSSSSSQASSKSDDLDELAEELSSLEIKSGAKFNLKEKERLQHAKMIRDLVYKVNQIYQVLHTNEKSEKIDCGKKVASPESFKAQPVSKSIPVEVSSGGYPSLDDL